MSLLPHRIKKYRILHTNTTYTLKHSCDTHYLSQNLKDKRTYTLELRESSLYIKDKESNKDIALMLTKEIPNMHPNMQEKTILLDSKDLQALQTTLGLHTHRDIREVYVEVELSKWDRLKQTYQTINKLTVPERYELVGGEPLKIYSPDNIHTENTCAMQISYILNENGMFLEKHISKKVTEQPIGIKDDFVLIGADNHNYIVRISTMIKLLKLGNLLGNADKSYNPKTMNTKAENRNFFYDELLTFNKNGLVAMEISGWNNAKGHITLWDKGHITLWDNDEKRFLDDSNYLLDTRSNVIVRQFYFWEIE